MVKAQVGSCGPTGASGWRNSNLEFQALTKEHCNEKFTGSFIKNGKLKKTVDFLVLTIIKRH